MRDLDHSSQNVQTIVKAYLDMLLNDFGYAGFRYDMVKGYSGKFTGIYNDATKPTYSVGEYWNGNVSVVKNWLEATKVNDKSQAQPSTSLSVMWCEMPSNPTGRP